MSLDEEEAYLGWLWEIWSATSSTLTYFYLVNQEISVSKPVLEKY